VGGVRAWPYKDKNAPHFNEDLYEVAKYSILKVMPDGTILFFTRSNVYTI